MKRIVLYFISVIVLCSIPRISYSQIAINSDGIKPDSSAMLDVQSATQGLLLPRLTTDQRDAIQQPADGLMIFNTDTKILEAFSGNTWTDLNRKKTSAIICGVSTIDFGGITYNTVMHNGRCWLDRNIGATQVATAINDSQGFGYYFQWGRADDGHQHPANGTTSTVANTSTPGHSSFILPSSPPYDWQDPQHVDLWGIHEYKNNPCPEGWKVPNIIEWNEAFSTWNNSTDAFDSPLKLPEGGHRSYIDGSFATNSAAYWTSSTNGSGSKMVFFDNASVGNYKKYRARGFPIRCIETVANEPFSFLSRAYGGTDDDRAFSLDQASDGSFVLAGMTASYGAGSNDFLLLKVDATGNLDFGKSYDEAAANNDCYSAKLTSDNGYILTGGTGTDVYNLKLDAQGNIDWEERTSYGGYEKNRDVIQDMDGGFVFVGYTDGFGLGGSDNLVTKRDASGNNVWGYAIGNTGNEYGYGIIKDTDGGYAICGASNSSGVGGYDLQFQKLDAGGNSLWGWYMGGTENDYGRDITLSHDSGYVIAGYTYSFGSGGADLYIRKVNKDGSTGWGSVLGGADEDFGFSIVLAEDHGFAIVGQTKSFGAGEGDVWLVKLDSTGNFEWSWAFGGTDHESGESVILGDDGCYYVAGYTRTFGGGGGTDDALFVKFAPDGSACLGYFVGLPDVSSNMTFAKDDQFTATPISKLSFQRARGKGKSTKMKNRRLPNPSGGSRGILTTTVTDITPTTTTICEEE
ncbi:MAG: hypothetical protein DRI89_15345 [Bacteroidetes bacterium]|nr:MAG: hypothetical protein DRI89_15345 [Bacteroidota bacterium]